MRASLRLFLPLILVAAPARSAALGDPVTLPTLKVTASLVGGKSFKVTAAKDEDELVRPGTPPLTLRLSVERGTRCELWFWRNRDIGMHVDRPPHVPRGYEPRVWSQGLSTSFCADLPGAALEATVTFPGGPSAPEVRAVLPFFEEVARELASRPGARVVPTTLPISGLRTDLPDHNGFAWRVDSRGKYADKIVRVGPDARRLTVAVRLASRNPPVSDCAEANAAFAKSEGGKDGWGGTWLPRSFASRVVSAKKGRLHFACADVPAGLVLVVLSNRVPLEKTANGVHALLGSLAIAASRAPPSATGSVGPAGPSSSGPSVAKVSEPAPPAAGPPVQLPLLGVSVQSPLALQVRSTVRGDELFQTQPRLLILRFNTFRGTCDYWVQRSAAGALVDRPRYLPSRYHPRVTEVRAREGNRAELCADVPTGVIWVTLLHAGELSSPEVLQVGPVLDAVANAVAADPHPVTNLLPVSGLRVALPGGRRVIWDVGRGQYDKLDHLRYVPGTPGNPLAVTVEVKPHTVWHMRCADEISANLSRAQVQSHVQAAAPWLPAGYYTQWVHRIPLAGGSRSAWVCADGGGKLLTLTVSARSFDDPATASILKPLLESLVRALQPQRASLP